MVKRLSAIVLIWAGLCMGQNILLNPGFEAAVDGRPASWTTGHSWYEKPKGSGLAETTLDREVFQGPGQQSLRMRGKGNRGIAQQHIEIKPEWGTRFTLSGWMRLRDTGSASGRIGVECIDGDNQYLGSGGSVTTDWRKSTADWERFETAVQLKAGTKALRVHCVVPKPFAGTVWFDNLVLEPVASVAAVVETTQAAGQGVAKTKASAAGKADHDTVEALIPVDDFESEDMAWSGNAWGGAQRPEFSLIQENPRFGEQCLRVTCASAKGNMVDRVWNYDGPWNAVSLWVRRVSGSGGMTLYVFCDQVVFHATHFNPGSEWQRVAARVEDFRYAWGAKDDKEKVFDPSAVTKLSFGHEDVITFDIDQVALDTDAGLVLRTAYTERRANLFARGERPDVVVEMINANEEPTAAVLEVDLVPWRGEAIAVTRRDLTLAPRTYSRETITLPALDQVYSSARVRLIDRGRVVGRHSVGLCALPEPVSEGRAFMGASGFGLGPSRADLGRKMGVRATEIMINWRTAEPEPGDYRLDGIGEALDSFEEHGFQTTAMILIMPSRTPEWALPEIRSDRTGVAALSRNSEAFAEFLREIARRYGDRFHDYSFCCEINLLAHRLERGTEGYIDLVKAGAAAIREADPEALIGGIGVSGGDARKTPRFPVARALWERLHEDLDGFFFDAYASPRFYGQGLRVMEPEENDLVGIMRDAVALVRQYGPDKQVAIEEKGWAIDSRLPVDAPEARAMAACLMRSYLLARSVDEVKHYMWFQVDTGRSMGGYSYSLFRHEGDYRNPRPAVAAYASTARFLAGTEEPRRVPMHQDLYALALRRGEGSRAALWTPLENPVTFDVTLPDGVTVTDMLGQALPADAVADGLQLSREPLLLWAEHVPVTRLTALLSRGAFRLPCAALAASRPDRDTLRVHIRNLLSGPLTGRLQITGAGIEGGSGETVPVSLAAQEVAALAIPTPGTPVTAAYSVRLTSAARGPVNITAESRPMLVRRLTTPPVIDGQLDEFGGVPAVVLDGHTFLDPPDATAAGLWTGIDDLSAELFLAWDSRHLYLAARVRDDTFVQERTGSGIWANDALQIAFDPLNDAAGKAVDGRSGYGEDDKEFGIALTPDGPQTYQWTGAPDGQGRFPPGAQLAVRREDPYTLYEWAVPWELVGRTPAPEAGDIIGFNAVVLDVDQKGKTARYWMGITPGICGGKDPSQFRDALLIDEE